MMDKNRTVQKLITLFLSLFLIIGSIGFRPVNAEGAEIHTDQEPISGNTQYPGGHYYCNDPILVTATGGEWAVAYKKGESPTTTQDGYFYSFDVVDGEPFNLYDGLKGNRAFDTTPPPGFNMEIMLFATKGDYTSKLTSIVVHIDSDPGTGSTLSLAESTIPEGQPVSIASTSFKRDAWVGIYEGTHSAGDTFGNDYLAKYVIV